jgi:hypothetical protein
MRAQPPAPQQRTTPLSGNPILAVINDQLDLAQFASQRDDSSPPLPEGEKLRRFRRLVLADAPAVVGAPIHGFPPRPLVQCQPDGETVGLLWVLASYDDTACLFALCRSRKRHTPILRTVSRCTPKVQISDDQMDELNLLRHTVLPEWNYTLFPRLNRN